MKPLLKMIGILLGVFLFIFALLNLTGWLTQESLIAYLESAKQAPPWLISLIVISLLVADIAIAVPSAGVTLLSGNLLGWALGALSATVGLSLAGCIGYGMSYRYGTRILEKTYKNAQKRQELRETFAKHATAWLLFSRIVPMFPEIASCLAGATKMPFRKYLTLHTVSSAFYSIALSTAGSISSRDNLTPAIIIYLIVMLIMWAGWWFFVKREQRATKVKDES